MNRIHARDREREEIRHWNLSYILFQKKEAFQSFPERKKIEGKINEEEWK